MNKPEFVYLKRIEESTREDRTYPFDLYIAMKEREDFICIGEGQGFGSIGCSMAPLEFISGKWDEYIVRFKAEWLKALIEEIGVYSIKQSDIVDYWKNNNV